MISRGSEDPGKEARAQRAMANPRYKWVALSNTTLGILMVTINSSIMLIALPDIFQGIKVNPLTPGNSSLLLWLILGFLVVTAVLVVSFGRVGDMYGRVKMYNLGFAVFTVFSILLSVTWFTGTKAALWLIIMRVLQGVGGAFLFANSSAILTDAFPEDQRGLALGVNGVAAIGGSFIGLILGGLLGPVDWRLVFLVSVPFGLFGTIWAYLKLVDTGVRKASTIDWWGNLTFAIGLISVLVGIVYGIEPYGGHNMGWTNPGVLSAIIGGVLTLVVFAVIETKVTNPMFQLPLFRIRAFAAGNIASLMAAMGRGGLMFILIIWLQGIWLPQHGYSFTQTPLWAGIYMVPLTIGFLIAGPLSGILSDRYGARPFATGGMILAAITFALLELLPVNFSYLAFAALILVNGIAMGLFASPNRAGIMNSLPPTQRGAGAGMSATFQNSATVLSIGVFFTLIIIGLSATLPHALYSGLVGQGVPHSAATQVSKLPPVGTLFAALLGYNPVKELLGPSVLAHVSQSHAAFLTGRSFFPSLISGPFKTGLRYAFDFAVVACVIAAIASWLRGGKYIHQEPAGTDMTGPLMAGTDDGTAAPALATVGATSFNGSGNGNGNGNGPGHQEAAVTGTNGIAGNGYVSSGNGSAGNGSAGHGVQSQPAEVGARSALVGAAGSASYSTGAAAGETHPADTPHAPAVMSDQSRVAPGAGGSDAGHPPRGVIRGSIRSSDRLPLAGAVVTAIGSNRDVDGRTVAGADGTFVVDGLTESDGYTVLASAPGRQPNATVVRLSDGAAGTADFTLVGSASLTVSVRDGGDAPLAGAMVTLTDGAGRVVDQRHTNDGGGCRFEDLTEGDHTVVAQAEHHQLQARAITVVAGDSPVELRLSRNATVSGVVRLAATGTPLVAATVTLTDAAGQVVHQVVTGPESTFSFTDLGEGDYTVVASGYDPVAQSVHIDGGESHVLDLELGHAAPDLRPDA